MPATTRLRGRHEARPARLRLTQKSPARKKRIAMLLLLIGYDWASKMALRRSPSGSFFSEHTVSKTIVGTLSL